MGACTGRESGTRVQGRIPDARISRLGEEMDRHVLRRRPVGCRAQTDYIPLSRRRVRGPHLTAWVGLSRSGNISNGDSPPGREPHSNLVDARARGMRIGGCRNHAQAGDAHQGGYR